MRFLLFSAVLAFCLLTAVYSAEAEDSRAEVQVRPAVFKPGCAPWDGSTIEIDIPDIDNAPRVHITLWGAGLLNLVSGKTIDFSDKDEMNSNASGAFRQCDKSDCKATYGRLEVKDYQPQKTLDGVAWVPLDGKGVRSIGFTFKAHWPENAQPVPCG